MKKKLLALLSLVSFTILNAQTGYHIQHHTSSPYVKNKDSIYLSVGSTNKASVLLVDPNTKNWQYLNSSFLQAYGQISMKDKNNGIMLIATSNSVQVTSNGWQTVSTSTASYPFVAACPTGYFGHFNTGSSTTLVYSTNGLNWSNSTMPGFFTVLAARNYGNRVIALPTSSSFSVMLSNNAGQTYTGIGTNAVFTGTFREFYMSGPDTLLVFMSNTLCKSFDAGATWTNTALPATINNVAIKNKNEFAIETGSGPTFSFTTNGGATWSACINNAPLGGAGALKCIGNYYYLFPWFRTNDLGNTWESFLPNNLSTNPFSIDFNGNKGLIGIGNGNFTYSTDKGRSLIYSSVKLSSNQDMMATKVLSNGNFYAGDRKGQVFTSNDNGQTWVKKNTETLSPNSIRFLLSANENTVVLTRAGLPVVSVDGGTSFSVVTTATSGGNHLQALTPNGTLMDMREINGFETRTFDINGNTTVISTYTVSGSESLLAFYMTSNTVGYVLTRENTSKINKVYKTTNGGVSWSPMTDIAQVTSGSSAYGSSFPYGIPLFHNFGTDTILVTANFNNFYHVSYDGANTWTTVTPSFTLGNNNSSATMIYRMNFFSPTSFMSLIGDNFGPLGVFLNTAGGSSSSIGINELKFDKEKNELILFPNPGRNSDQISFLNVTEETLVTILNLNGEKVNSEITTSGRFSVEGLSQGMYIVQVTEKNKAPKTAKLILQ